MEAEPLHTAAEPPTPFPPRTRSNGGRGPSLKAPGTPAPQAARRWPPILASACALIMVLALARIMLAAVGGDSPVVPAQPSTAGELAGITGEHLTYRLFLATVLVFGAAYGGLAGLSRHVPMRALIALIALLYAIVFVGPIIVSTDVFSYIAYARMGLLHGLNPYVSAPFAIRHDLSYRYVGTNWLFVPTAYGPLYTLLSYPLALVGMVGAVWGMKLMALASTVAIDWLVWRCARLRDRDPKLALLLVALNPLVVIYSLASAQNDLVMVALMVLGVFLSMVAPAITGKARGRLRSEAGGAAIVLAALVKVPAAVVLPYLLISRRRVSALAGAITMLVAGLVMSYAVFGIHGVNLLAGLNRDAAYVSVDSFGLEIQHMLGKPGLYPVDHLLLKGVFALTALYLLWRTWRGYDWIAASGWTLLTMSVAATWIQPWYLIWPLPLAVIARDRRLLSGTLLIQCLFIVHQLSPLFAPR